MKLVFLNRCYWPDSEATGQLLTELCEHLAPRHQVTVITGQPNAPRLAEGESFVKVGQQQRHGVTIQRANHLRLNKGKSFSRLANLISFTFAASRVLRKLPQADLVITETDPFLLPLAVHREHRRRGTPFVAYLQDIYPDVAIAVGAARESRAVKQLRERLKRAYLAARRVIVLSDSMRDRLQGWGIPAEQLSVIPNWVDCEKVFPWTGINRVRQDWQISAQDFLVMHSGNMGLTQPLDQLVAAAADLAWPTHARLVLVGGGCRESALRDQIHVVAPERAAVHGYQPKDRLAESLSAADLQVIASDERVDGCLAPSKLYGILAAGKPVLVIGSDRSDTATFVKQHQLGYCCPPEPAKIAQAVATAVGAAEQLQAMGQRARTLALAHFDKPAVLNQLESCFMRCVSR